MASAQMKAAAQAIRENSMFTGSEIDLAVMRAGMEQTALPVGEGISRKDFSADGLNLTHIAASDVRNDRGVLYLHGGGYVLGSLNTHAELMGRISAECRAPVLGVEYRLAPEHPYPAALDDALAAYQRLLSNGIKPEQIVIAGDSAGGGLSLACLLALKEAGLPLPAGAMLLSPWTDLTGSGASIKSRADADPMVSARLLDPMVALYKGDQPADLPRLSPLFGDLSGLPPLLIQVGDAEILLDDSTRLSERAKAAGVDATLQIYDGAFHVFQNMPDLPESAEALKAMAGFFDRVTGP
ncbi:MAG: alpha/beta hydrolase [Proteobacteria bacterium]|nr:alpha/beta hydrolase [Pseudomonadota bacterium]